MHEGSVVTFINSILKLICHSVSSKYMVYGWQCWSSEPSL